MEDNIYELMTSNAEAIKCSLQDFDTKQDSTDSKVNDLVHTMNEIKEQQTHIMRMLKTSNTVKTPLKAALDEKNWAKAANIIKEEKPKKELRFFEDFPK